MKNSFAKSLPTSIMQGSAILSWIIGLSLKILIQYHKTTEYQLRNEMKQFSTSLVILDSFDTKTSSSAENMKRLNKMF